jgi:hypothetical protein
MQLYVPILPGIALPDIFVKERRDSKTQHFLHSMITVVCMLVLTIVDYAPADNDTEILNIALIFGTSPANGPASWSKTEAWEQITSAGGDETVLASEIDKLTGSLGTSNDHLDKLEALAGSQGDVYLEEPIPVLYNTEEEAFAFIRGALATRADIPVTFSA